MELCYRKKGARMNTTGDTRYAQGVSAATGVHWGFVPVPIALTGGLTAQQIAWQQEIYRRAYAAAQAAVGYKVFKPVLGFGAKN